MTQYRVCVPPVPLFSGRPYSARTPLLLCRAKPRNREALRSLATMYKWARRHHCTVKVLPKLDAVGDAAVMKASSTQ